MCLGLTGAPFCCQSDLRPAFLLHGHHHCPQPHLWCHHWHFCWPEERETEERGDTENDVFHLWWGNNRSPQIDADLGNSEMRSVSGSLVFLWEYHPSWGRVVFVCFFKLKTVLCQHTGLLTFDPIVTVTVVTFRTEGRSNAALQAASRYSWPSPMQMCTAGHESERRSVMSRVRVCNWDVAESLGVKQGLFFSA